MASFTWCSVAGQQSGRAIKLLFSSTVQMVVLLFPKSSYAPDVEASKVSTFAPHTLEGRDRVAITKGNIGS